ncbi:MAG: hypothetical protein MUC38_03215 [Cyclobacteriaceae bacterium]|nr:hypothetical protein [Cyclobacteriaceae bacterium]
MNKEKVFLYGFVILVGIKIGLIYPTRQLENDIIEMSDRFEVLRDRVEGFQTFDDSLAGSDSFRQRLLDTISTAGELRQMRRNQGDELTKQMEEFKVRYPDRGKMIKKHRILNGLSTLLDVVLVCMAIPLVIPLFKGR